MGKEQAVRRQYWSVSLVSWLPVVGQLAILVGVAIVLLLPAPFVQNQLPAVWTGSDLLVSHWPAALLIQRTFAQEHRLPLWNPYFGGGLPLVANPLAALFYPPTQLVHFLSLHDYFYVLLMGHLVFAGLGMLFLTRRVVKLPNVPALVAAVSYMATPRLISHLGAGHVTIVQTVAWYPWLALASWATVHDPRRWGAVLGICLALTLLAGHPQMAYYGLLMIVGQVAWLLLVSCWRLKGLRALLSSAGGLAAAAVIGVLMAAVHLLPLIELTAFSARQTSLGAKDAYPLPDFLHALLDQQLFQHSHEILTQLGNIRSIPQLATLPGIINTLIHQPPPSRGPWESMVTPGLVVLFLALFGLVTHWRKAYPLAIGIVLVTGLAVGNASPFYGIVSHILLYIDQFRGLNRIWFLSLLMIAILAGLGTKSLIRIFRYISPHMEVFIGHLIVLAIVFTLVVTDMGYAHSNDVRLITTFSLLARMAARLAGSGRIYDMQGNIPQRSAVQLQAQLASGQDPLLIESYVSYMQRAGGYSASGYQLHIPSYDARRVRPNAVLLGMMHVSIVVSRRLLTDRYLVRVAKVHGVLIYKNTVDAGPAYLVRPGQNGHPSSFDTHAHVRMLVQTPEEETFTFSNRAVEYFVIAMPTFPGWSANLDGRPVPIGLMAGELPTIRVGPGKHTLSYIYAPLSVYLGAMLSVVGLLATLAWFIIGYCLKAKPHR